MLLSEGHCSWLLRVAREKSETHLRGFAVKLLALSLSKGMRRFLLAYTDGCTIIIEQTCGDVLDEHALGALDEIAGDGEHPWLTEGAFAMFTTILSQSKHSI